MLATSTLSLIALVASYTNKPCTEVFEALAKDQIAIERQLSEDLYLKEFAEEACLTSNPDVVWQIAKVETNFHFEIIRFNNTNQVYKGTKAVDYLKDLENTKTPVNIDIGIMQVNWYWHRSFFANSSIQQLSPASQVRYLVMKMAPIVTRMCSSSWMGCYHNPANGPRAGRHNKWIGAARRSLEKSALKFVNQHSVTQIPLRFDEPMTKAQEKDFYRVARNYRHTDIKYLAEYMPTNYIKPADVNRSLALRNSPNFGRHLPPYTQALKGLSQWFFGKAITKAVYAN